MRKIAGLVVNDAEARFVDVSASRLTHEGENENRYDRDIFQGPPSYYVMPRSARKKTTRAGRDLKPKVCNCYQRSQDTRYPPPLTSCDPPFCAADVRYGPCDGARRARRQIVIFVFPRPWKGLKGRGGEGV